MNIKQQTLKQLLNKSIIGINDIIDHQVILHKLQIQKYQELLHHHYLSTLQSKMQQMKDCIDFFQMKRQQETILSVNYCLAIFQEFKVIVQEKIRINQFYLHKNGYFVQIYNENQYLIFNDQQGDIVWRKQQGDKNKYVNINLLKNQAVIGEPENKTMGGYKRLNIYRSEDEQKVQLGHWKNGLILKWMMYKISQNKAIVYKEFKQDNQNKPTKQEILFLKQGQKRKKVNIKMMQQ